MEEVAFAVTESTEKEPYFAWSEELSCGDERIDDDHQRLFDIANRLYTAHAKGLNRAAVGAIFAELIGYTQFHFFREERLMRQIGFPALAAHQAQHRRLLSHLQLLQDSYFAGEAIAIDDVCQFMRGWVCRHIMNADLQVIQFQSKSQSQDWPSDTLAVCTACTA